MTSNQEILRALDEVIDPELGQSAVKLNLIRDIQMQNQLELYPWHLFTLSAVAGRLT